MKRLHILAIAAALAFTVPALAQTEINVNRAAKSGQELTVAQATPQTTTVRTDAPVTTTTTVDGGGIAAAILEWIKVAFGTIISGALALGVSKLLKWMGVQVTDQLRAQLQVVIVNGINIAVTRLEDKLRQNKNLDVDVKNEVVADAVKYVQDHAADTIKSLGLDPQSGAAVEAIRARIETALVDPQAPTKLSISPIAKVETVANGAA